ncbi:MAG: pantetheine-phosphate adenylyltransferase [Ignavibacteria bacterium]|nr:pantetheine-phosphate adenylyltransferase [Ignavibacteria bacterium]
MQITALYPGTFDPITNGHLDIIQRASEMFHRIIVTVALNPSKSPLFSVEERIALISESVKHLPNVTVTSFSGLIVDYARQTGAKAIIRGLRAVSDFEYEFQMALMNYKLNNEVNTVFLMPNEKYTYLNSSIIRQLNQFEADVSEFVPPCVVSALELKLPRA